MEGKIMGGSLIMSPKGVQFTWILKLLRTITGVLLERGTMTQGIKYSGREEEKLGELQTTTRSNTRR